MTRFNRLLVLACAVVAPAVLAVGCETQDVSTSRLELEYEELGGQCPVHGTPIRNYQLVRMMPGIEGPAPVQPPEECDEPWGHVDTNGDDLCDVDQAPVSLVGDPEPAGEPVPGSDAGVVAKHCEWRELTACGAPIMDPTNTTAVGCNETWADHTCNHKAPNCDGKHGSGATFCRAFKARGKWTCEKAGNQTRKCAAK